VKTYEQFLNWIVTGVLKAEEAGLVAALRGFYEHAEAGSFIYGRDDRQIVEDAQSIYSQTKYAEEILAEILAEKKAQ
jgi:UDP-N-acetylmuramoylalanine-D-glutamate ligase